MDTDKEDLRVIRTRKLLSNTLLEMMEQQPIEKISVIDLCGKAMVNRATFYAHFEDKYHLLSFALEELKDELYSDFMGVKKMNSPQETVRALMIMAVDFFYNEHNHIANILRYNKGGKVISTIQESIAQSIKYQINKYRDSYIFLIPSGVLSNFLAGGMVNLAERYIENPGKYNYEDFIGYANTFVTDAYFQPRTDVD